MVLAAATLWASGGLFIDGLSVYGLTGTQITAERMVMVVVVVFLFLLIQDPRKLRVNPRDLGWMALNGFFGSFVFNLCYTYAIQLTGMATAAVLLYLMPSLVMVFSVAFLGERFTSRKGLCLVLSLVGCALVSGMAEGFTVNPAGLAMGLIAAVCYAFYNILVGTKLKQYSSFTNTLYLFAFGAIPAIISVVVRGEHTVLVGKLVSQPRCLLLCLGHALCCSVFSYVLYNTAVKKISASKASIIATFEPVAAALLGFFFLNQGLSGFALGGICCELLALILLNLPEKVKT